VEAAESIAQPPLTQYIETAGVVVRIKTLKNPPMEVVAPPVTGTLVAVSTEPAAPKEEPPTLPRIINGELFPLPPVVEPAVVAGSELVEGSEPVEGSELVEGSEPVVEPAGVVGSATVEEIPAMTGPAAEPEIPAVTESAAVEEIPVVTEPAEEPEVPAAEEPAVVVETATAEPAVMVEEPVPATAEAPTPAEPDPVPEFRTRSRRTTAANGTAGKPAKGAKPAASKRGRKSLKQVSAEADLIEIPADDVLFSKQYYTMGEVSEMFRVNQSLLRFWETEFDILQPRKNKKGDRYFRPVDIKNLHLIYHLLRQKKFTIEGAKDFLKKNKKAEERFEIVQRLQEIRSFLLEWKAQL